MGNNIPFASGGGGVFVTTFDSGVLAVAAGASGDIVTITPPSGQRASLTAVGSSGAESGVTITVNAAEVVDSKTIRNDAPSAANHYTLNSDFTSTGTGRPLNTVPIIGGTDEVIKIIKDAATTSAILYYQYQFGELK